MGMRFFFWQMCYNGVRLWNKNNGLKTFLPLSLFLSSFFSFLSVFTFYLSFPYRVSIHTVLIHWLLWVAVLHTHTPTGTNTHTYKTRYTLTHWKTHTCRTWHTFCVSHWGCVVGRWVIWVDWRQWRTAVMAWPRLMFSVWYTLTPNARLKGLCVLILLSSYHFHLHFKWVGEWVSVRVV